MKLHDTVDAGLTESKFFVFCEAGEGPKWDFDYANYKNDPKPSILVLGAYQHPSTGNNLVGGINLNYLDATQRNELAKVLPKLMQQTNLYSRYHLGKKLLPAVFGNSYRTYNSAHIRGVTAGVMHPRYGMLQTGLDFFKKKVGGLLKSKEQRAKDLEPKFPNDLSGMKDALDQAVNRLGLEVATGEEEPDTPEMQAASRAFQKFQADKKRSMADIEAEEDEPSIQAAQNYQNPQVPPPQVAPAPVQLPQATQKAQPTPQSMGREIAQEREENQQELRDPNNSIDLDGDGLPDQERLQESVVYYCPLARRYLVESVGEVIAEWERDNDD